MNKFNPSLYDILGRIPRDASDKDIKDAYRTFAKLYHPDKNPNDKVFAQEKMQELNEAYAILSDPQKRAEYNAKLLERDELLRKQQEEKKRRENAEKLRQAAERAMNNKPKATPPQSRSITRDSGDGLMGAALAVVALGLLLSALSKDK